MNMRKRLFALAMLCLVLAMLSAVAAADTTPRIPRTLSNARFVYVTAYDGDQFNVDLLPEEIGRAHV